MGNVGSSFLYSGLNFTAITALSNTQTQANEPTSLTIVSADNSAIPEVESGVHALEAMYLEPFSFTVAPTTESLSIVDSNRNGGGRFVAISAYLNGETFTGIGATINLSGMLGAVPQPNCSSPSFPLNAPGTTSGPDRVFFADVATDCTVDALIIDTTNNASGSGGLASVFISLDEFVVCKANNASGLQGVLPG